MSLMRVPIKRSFVVHFQKNPNPFIGIKHLHNDPSKNRYIGTWIPMQG